MNLLPRRRRVLFAVFLATLFLAANAARAAVLRGYVTDAVAGFPLTGVVLDLSPAAGETGLPTRRAETDGAGDFAFTDLPPGRYILEFDTSGYEILSREVALDADEETELAIELAPFVTELDDVVVVARQADAEAELQTSYQNLDAATLREIPGIVESDPLRSLQALPGVAAASDISSGLYIRGGGPDQTLVMMDGVPVYNPTHAFGFFSTFNADAIDGIALYKGAYPASYGGRLGSVLDVQMLRPYSERVSGVVGVSLIAARGLVQGELGQDNWLVSGRRTYLEPLLNAIRTEEDPIPDYFFYDVNATYTSTRGGGRTTFQFYQGRDNVQVDADVNTYLDLGWGNRVMSLRHERALGRRLDASVIAYSSRYSSGTDAEILATNFNVDNELEDLSIGAKLDWRPGGGHLIGFGVTHSWYDFSYQQSFNRDQDINYLSQPRELSTYLEDRWFGPAGTTFRGGLRARYIDDGDRVLLEPRFSISREIQSGVRFKIGGGVYNQYLQLVSTEGLSSSDFYVPIDATADLGRSWQTVVGLEWQLSAADLLSIEFYNTDLKNLVTLDNRQAVDSDQLTAEEIFVTGGGGYARGAEVFLRRSYGRMQGWFGYTLGFTNRQFSELNGGAAFKPKYDRRHDVNLLLSYDTGGWRLGANFRYATGQAFTPAAARFQLRDPGTGEINDIGQVLPASRNSARLLPYHRLDVSARRGFGFFGLPAELVLEVFNIYNRRNEWFVQYDTSGAVTEVEVIRMLPMIPSVGVNVAF